MIKKSKKKYFIFLIALVGFLGLSFSPVFSADSPAKNSLSITDQGVFQKSAEFLKNVWNSFVQFWNKYIGEPASRVWDRLRFFFINSIMTRWPDIKKEFIREVGEAKQDIPKQTSMLVGKFDDFLKH